MMDRIDLDDSLEPGLYLISSDSPTVYVLNFRKSRAGSNWNPSTMIRIPIPGSSVGPNDLQWCPLVKVCPPTDVDGARSWIEVGRRSHWVFGSSDPTEARHSHSDFSWLLQRMVTSIERISYADLLDLGAERGVQIPGDEHGLGGLLWRTASGTELLVECEPGWWPILAELDVALAAIAPDYLVEQVKEKFGGLRFYATPDRFGRHGAGVASEPLSSEAAAEFRRLVDEAERRSFVTCEICGQPGKTRKARGWLKTVCDHHAH